jgi:putative spermidine/putrescine transport system substrate-binding protein
VKHLLRIPFRILAGVMAIAGVAVEGAWAQGDLTVVSWGGAYTKSQMLAYVIPYEQANGVRLNVEAYNGGLKEIRDQVEAYNVKWDVVDMELGDVLRGCQQGLLEKIDHSVLPPAPDGTPAEQDFLPGMLPDCAVGQVIWSTVMVYNTERFKDDPPTTLADFFDTGKYPGKRGLRNSPKVNLEWALLADGVSAAQVYETLNTEAGLQRAFDKLDSIRDDVIWWEDGAEPSRRLAQGETVMSSAFNGRIYDAIADKRQPFRIVWDGQAWEYDMWAIPKRTERTSSLEAAMAFVKFATDTQRLADQANYISYGPSRRSSLAILNQDIKSHLPTAPANAANALRIDAQWWAERQDVLERRFEHWRARRQFLDWYSR